ncbi:MAG: Ig-like domain-containing protein [Ignavibacteriales bacterium]|nr:Ig-like domain-containing protein [Ignavibacteriales bacterium]
MKSNLRRLLNYLSLVFLIMINSCSDDNITGPGYQSHIVRGFAQKGPFIQGSQIRLQLLDNTLTPTGKVYESETKNNIGYYESPTQINSACIEVISEGFYFNEVTGSVSSTQIKLKSLASIVSSDTVNVNILTTIASKRINYLVTQKKNSFDDAKQIAEKEILKIFNIVDPGIKDFEKMDITKAEKNDAVLLAVSCIVQANFNVAQLSEFIAKLSSEIETDGIQNDSSITLTLYQNALSISNTNIRYNLNSRYQQLGLNLPIPDFEAYTKLLIPLTVSYINPYNGSLNNPISTKIDVMFNKAMNPSTINSNSFIVSKGSNNITGTFYYNPAYNSIQFTPANKLVYGSDYNVHLTTDIKSYDGESLDSNYNFSFTTLEIPKPQILYPHNNQNVTETSFILDWYDFDGAISYSLQLSTTLNFNNNIIDVNDLTVSQFQISTPLANNVKYYWRVKVKTTEDVWSDWSNVSDFTIKLTTVRYPNPSSYSYITDTTPLLDWEDVNSTTQYHLQVNNLSNFTGYMIIDINNLTESKYQTGAVFSDYNSYYWRVKRMNTDGVWSDWSEGFNFNIMMSIPELNQPYNSEVTLDRTPRLKWTSVNGATGYHLQLSTSDDFSSNLIINDENLSYNEYQISADLPYDDNYYWRVRVKNSDNVWSRWTYPYYFTIPRLDITTGLLFYYPFNGNTLDESGNSNNSTGYGITLTSDRQGNLNSAYKFDANGDYLEMPGIKALASSEWSYSIWIKMDGLPSYSTFDAFLFSYKNVQYDDDAHLYVDDADDAVKAYLGNIGITGGTNNVVNRKVSTNVQVNTNSWVHLCITHNPAIPRLTFYINGQRVTTANDKFGTTYPVNTPYLISCITNFGNNKGRFFGSADEVYFYDKELNLYEVNLIYNK